MVCFFADYSSIIIYKFNCVINISSCICCCVCCITFTYARYFIIPTSKCVSISLICFSSRIIRNHNSITIMVSLRTNYITIVIIECNCVINISSSICCFICSIFSYCNNFIIPTSKCISVCIICCFTRISWSCWNSSIFNFSCL